MKVHPSHTGEVTAAHAAHAASAFASKSSTGTSFAKLLATSTSPATTTATTAPGTDVAEPAISLKKGETMKAVPGHAYAEISGGKRDGMYVNTSHNKRHGQAFVLVHKNGRDYHIYGTGKHRLVVALRKPTETAKSDTTTPSNTAAGTGGSTPTVSAS